MFHNLKYLTVIALLALPLTADAEQRGRGRRGQGGQRQQSGQHAQGGHRAQGGHHQQQKLRSPRAEALAPPSNLAQVLLPAGARRVNERVAPPRQGLNPWLRPQRPGSNHRWHNGYPFGFGSYYAVGNGGYGYYEMAQDEPAPPPPAAAMTNKGLLQLQITPASGLDYYMDGVHIGSSSNLGSEFEVNAGARQIEVRARGYKPATFDVRINEGQVTTVRGALEPIEQPQAPRNTGSQVMYVIPGCYMGNSKPAPGALSPGCDIRKMTTRGGL